MTKEQFDTAQELIRVIEHTKERIKVLDDMDCYETLTIKQPSVGMIVITGDIRDTVIRLIREDEQKTLEKAEKALEVL